MVSFVVACENSKHNEILKIYIKQSGVDLNVGLERAIENKSFVNAKTLSDYGASFYQHPDYHETGQGQWSYLQYASLFNLVDILRLGIYRGANVHDVTDVS